MKSLLILLLVLSISASADSLDALLKPLYSSDGVERENYWNDLKNSGRIPLTAGDSVAFLYKGEARQVSWMGDFNGWGYDKTFRNKGVRIAGTDIWVLELSFPADARLDYKIIVDDQWILDPNNPHTQWSGVGGGSPNSELRMPRWKIDPLRSTIPTTRGKLSSDVLINSKELNYQVTYRLYIPHGFEPGTADTPILYVTDGYEYIHDEMGSMTLMLDNLIALGKIRPLIAVFVDHREPINRSNNRRMQELAMNPQFLKFFVTELIPKVEGDLKLSVSPAARGILGTSMGGLNAAYFGFSRPDIFGLAGIQSPAFWIKPEIYTICDNPEKPPVKVFLTTGLINDSGEGSEKMKTILEKNACTFQYKEVNQGHSWGHWKDLLDDILIYFFPPK
jgi:enterochelin esterase-like enzyme